MPPNKSPDLGQVGIDYGNDPTNALLRARREAGHALVGPQAPSRTMDQMDQLVSVARSVLAALLAILGLGR